MKTIHLLISGKVQGVFYRVSARDIADSLDVKGWIKNRSDQKVEALVSGNPDNLLKFVDWCKTGPVKASVESVDVKEQGLLKFKDFEILH